jgi:predicted amino acid dehydrogenase
MHTKSKVALIGHPPDMDMFRAYIGSLKPGRAFRDDLLLKLFEWTPSYKVKSLADMSFDNQRYIDGCIVMVPFLPEMRDIRLRQVTEKIEKAIAIAADEGCDIAALGAFNSIILQGREQELSDRYGVRLTSGNALTAALVIRSIEELCERYELDCSDLCVGIVGASGDIGSACTRYFASRAKKLILTARGLSGLETLAAGVREARHCPIDIATDNQRALNEAQVCILVTSAHQNLFAQSDFRPGCIVCDASAPVNVKIDGPLRDDLLVYHGGIAALPFPVDFGFDIGLPDPRCLYGCMTEGILAAANPSVPCSWGRGAIDLERIERMRTCADAAVHVAYTIGNHRYTERELDARASAVLQWQHKGA